MTRTRFWLIVLLAAVTVLPSIGCGDLMRQSFKQGLFNYISGTFYTNQAPSQLGDYLLNNILSEITGRRTNL